MVLALCHSIPRDVEVQAALLLLFVTAALQAAAIGLRHSYDAAGYFTLRGSGLSVATVAGHPAIYTWNGSTLVKLCDPSAATLTRSCARFAEAFHAVNGLTVSSFVTCVLAVVAAVFVVVRVSRTTVGLLCRLACAACVPAALQCAAVGFFFARVVPHARRDAARAGGRGEGELVFHRRVAADLMVAAAALVSAGLVLLVARWMFVLCVRRQFESEPEHTKEGVRRLTAAHMVNDDGVRQRQILMSHARSVKVEMAVKRLHGGVDVLAASTSASHEPYNVPLKSSELSLRRTPSVAGGGSDDDTLKIRAPAGAANPGRSAAAAEGGSASEQPGSTPPCVAPSEAAEGHAAGQPLGDAAMREARQGDA
ncbi:hypothetical protein LSCM1_00198 [Leishmania martiniquensis]|uniref:Uncharacterized protein n=1 Tax=Leishmania martiniquensis TaxID=1580590 RepID=A0A836G2C3_9TRYP|nr:hypothetical protein LSCM1_00198 [Leishmania martiniquensis]